MRYNGGKTQMIRSYGMGDFWLREIRKRKPRRFVDACCGSAAVTTFVRREFPDLPIIASDIHPSLIALLKAISAGWKPPIVLTQTEYLELKAADARGEVSALIGFAGFACTFGAQWFAGKGAMSMVGGSSRSLIAAAPFLQTVDLRCGSYVDLLPEVADGDLWYFDKPYEGTQGYKGTPKFDHAAFWKSARHLAHRVDVLVSEFAAPEGWKELWSVQRKLSTRGGSYGDLARTEVITRSDKVFEVANGR